MSDQAKSSPTFSIIVPMGGVSGAMLPGEETPGQTPLGEKPSGEELVGEKPSGEKLVGEKLVEEELVGEKLVGEKLVEEKLVEEKLVGEKLLGLIRAEADALGESCEVIFVDDGSSDAVAAELRRLAEANGDVRLIELSRPFGRQAAILAGIDHAAGKAAMVLSAEAEGCRRTMAELASCWREGFEVVRLRSGPSPASAGRPGRPGRAKQRGGSLVARYKAWLAGPGRPRVMDLALFDGKVLDALRRRSPQAGPLDELLDRIGFRQTAIPSPAGGEKASQPGSQSQPGEYDQLAATMRAVRLLSLPGAALLAGAVAYLVISLLLWPFAGSAGTAIHLAVALAAATGVQLLALSLVGDRIARAVSRRYDDRPYIIREMIGFDRPEMPSPSEAPRSDEQQFTVFT